MENEEQLSDTIEYDYLNEWNEYVAAHQAFEDNCERINNRIFKAIKNKIGEGFLNDLNGLIEETECKGAFSFTRDIPDSSHFQMESDFGCISAIWVQQFSSGDSGDSFYGTIWVKIKNHFFLKMDFAC